MHKLTVHNIVLYYVNIKIVSKVILLTLHSFYNKILDILLRRRVHMDLKPLIDKKTKQQST